eukprot:gene16602-18934_t
MDGASGEVFAQYALPWDEITAVAGNGDTNSVLISGKQKVGPSPGSCEIARCQIFRSLLNCDVKTFASVLVGATSRIPHTRQIVMTGTENGNPIVSIADSKLNTIQSYTYTTPSVTSLTIDNIFSVPAFLGTFVVGTCMSNGPSFQNHLMFGWIRSYTGVLVAANLTPTSTNIVLSGESMTQAIAMDVTQLDMLIAGGLQLSDNAGVNAYVVRVNSLYQSVLYGVQYRYSVGDRRRALADSAITFTSVVKGMALVDTTLYVLVQITKSDHRTSVAVLKTNAASGAILRQARIEGTATNSSISCTDIVQTAFAFAIGCTVQYSVAHMESTVISIGSDLSFSKLPEGFVRVSDARFSAESVGFTASPLSVATSSIFQRTTQSKLNSTRDSYMWIYPPTPIPTEAPVIAPSSRPSVCTLRPSSSKPSIERSHSPTETPTASSGGSGNEVSAYVIGCSVVGGVLLMVVPIVDMHMPYLQTKAEKVRTGYDLSDSSEARSVRSDKLATSVEGSSMYSFPSELTDEYQCVRASHIAPRDNMSNISSMRSVSTSSNSSSDTSSHSSIHSVSTCSTDSDSD